MGTLLWLMLLSLATLAFGAIAGGAANRVGRWRTNRRAEIRFRKMFNPPDDGRAVRVYKPKGSPARVSRAVFRRFSRSRPNAGEYRPSSADSGIEND